MNESGLILVDFKEIKFQKLTSGLGCSEKIVILHMIS
jgi:hypothetical protein